MLGFRVCLRYFRHGRGWVVVRERWRGQSAASAITWLRNVTKLDHMQYILFGAHNVEEVEDGLECDKWLPVVGGAVGGSSASMTEAWPTRRASLV